MHGCRAWPLDAHCPPSPGAGARACCSGSRSDDDRADVRHYAQWVRGPELASSKALTLQILYPENMLYKNDLAVGAGAYYDDVIKRWIVSTPDLARSPRPGR